jgi:putative aldouronate transport system substrate-binding protein
MKWLDLIYTNADMMNTICWGLEGVHYVEGPDGLLTFPAGIDAGTSGYNHAMNWMFPNQYLLKVWTGDDPNLWTNMRAFNNNSGKSKALGFAFDSANVATEMTSVINVYEQYQKSLEFGIMDPAEGIPQMVSAMKSAGLDRIIAEKQAQLNEWAAVNGVS